jgi:pathogenesis-related protein 1
MAFPFASSLLICLVSLLTSVAARGGIHTNVFATPSQSLYLTAHNAVRAAHGAQPLTWSDSLAESARSWATNCNFRPTNGQLRDEQYGENIGAATGYFSVNSFLDSIVGDASSYDPSNPQFNGFTQVVWKATTEVGCATHRCPDLFPEHPGVATMYVCLYNPAGNIANQVGDNVQA